MDRDDSAEERRSLILGASSKPTAPPGTPTPKATDNLCEVSKLISNPGVRAAAVAVRAGGLQNQREQPLDRLYPSDEAGKVLGGLASKTMRNLVAQGVFTPEETWLDSPTHRVFTEAGLRRVRELRKANAANTRRRPPVRKSGGSSSGGEPVQPKHRLR